MGFNNCCHCKCFSCFYRWCFCFGGSCYTRNKTSPEYDNDRSPPTPSIALTIASASRSQADDQSIQDQLSLFHFGQKSPSGRRYSHPNQAKWVEEYERRKSQPTSPSPPVDDSEDNLSPVVIPPRPPESPVMQYPVIPPGRLL